MKCGPLVLAMKHSVSLPAMLAPSVLGGEDPRAIHPPFFTTSLVLSPALSPLGIVMGFIYLCAPKWRAAGAMMLALSLCSGLVAWLVYQSLH